MSCSGKRSWVQTGLRRGYIGCIVAAADSADDTEAFAALYPDYDFTCMGRRVWGLSRAIDYLTTLPIVDKAKITFSDHSRGGKLATWAGAFEERLAAVVGSSPVSGGAIPWRYCADRYANETLEMCVRNYPHWFHPRLRFFVGRENKLPFDMHEMLALTAPRGYMLTLGINEGEVNAWGEERGFLAARRVYEFLGAKDRIALRFRPGIHPTYASDIEDYFDWYDTVLGRRTVAPSADKLLYDYSFEKWKSLSGENPDIRSYPERAGASALGRDTDWNRKRDELRKRIIESLGESPGRAQAQAPRRALPSSPPGVAPGGGYADQILNRPRPTADIDRASLSFGNENVTGSLYYRREVAPHIRMPVVIWLHPYTYSTGYSRLPILPQGSSVYATGMYSFEAQGYLGTDFKTNSLLREGFAIFTYDMIGFGSRIPEARRFYERFPHWSLMGRMVDDVRSAVELLSGIERIDPRQIYVMGYSLGGTVGLLAAALDDRIAGAISFCGFTPLRLETAQKGTGSLDNYAFIHGLIPRLGFFKGAEKHLPWDFDEVLALIAPRPLMIVAPRFDQEATFDDVRHSVEQARRVYEFLKPGEQSAQAYDYRWSGIWRLGGARNVRLRNLELYAPPDYNHFSNSMQSVVYHWMRLKLLGESR